jgi:hypothetical protein
MKEWASAFETAILVAGVLIFLCVSVPACNEKRRQAWLKCVELRPNIEPSKCYLSE